MPEAARPDPDRPRPDAPRDDVHVTPHRAGEERRCPYCHEAVPDGALAGACERCGTLHHLGCFADHGGCATHGCDGARALGVNGRRAVPARAQLVGRPCGACRQPIDPVSMVARCGACGSVQHVACYETTGTCVGRPGGARCGAPRVVLMSHAEARAADQRLTGGVLLTLGLLFGVLFGGVALAAAQDQGPVLPFAALASISLLFAATGLAALLATPRSGSEPRRPGPSSGAKD
jgi:hypothetical protein